MPEPAKPDTVRSVPSVADVDDRPKTGASMKSKFGMRGKSAKSAKSALLEGSTSVAFTPKRTLAEKEV